MFDIWFADIMYISDRRGRLFAYTAFICITPFVVAVDYLNGPQPWGRDNTVTKCVRDYLLNCAVHSGMVPHNGRTTVVTVNSQYTVEPVLQRYLFKFAMIFWKYHSNQTALDISYR